MRGLPKRVAGLAVLALSACNSGNDSGGAIGGSVSGAPCASSAFCVGAAKARITPTHSHIEGLSEPRLGGYEVMQHFHLGGFGFGPFELARYAANSPLGEALSFSERTCEPTGGTCVSNAEATRRLHCAGFSDCTDDSATAEHTWVRALYLSHPTSATERGTELVLLTLDVVGAGNLVIEGVKDALIAEIPSLARENILVGMTHTHAGADLQGLWGGVPQDWVLNTLRVASVDAAKSARERARSATLKFATARDGAFNSYRRPRYQEDTADADPNLSVLQATASNGAVLATLVQYAAHPTAIGAESGGELGRVPHADYPLGLADSIEAATSAPAIYFNGPIADASGSGPTEGEDDYARVRSRGDCLARSALTLLNPTRDRRCEFSELPADLTPPTTLAPGIEVRTVTAQLPITNPLFLVLGGTLQFGRYYDFQPFALADIPGIGPVLAAEQTNLPQVVMTANTLVNRISLGNDSHRLEIVTMPGEATNTFGQYIRQLALDEAGTANVMLFGLTQNSFGYILPEEEYNFVDPSSDAGFVVPFTGYEEFVSLGPLTAPLLRVQAYNPLFGLGPMDPRNLPPVLSSCEDPGRAECAVSNLLARLDYIQRAYANLCRDNDGPEEFCALLDPETPLASPCRDEGLPEDLCDIAGDPATGAP